MRRIAIAGPEATGKSMLASALAERLNLPVIDDPRPAYLAALRCDTLFEANRYHPVWQQLLADQLEREDGADGAVVIDTCAIDYWVLWQRWGWCGASATVSESYYKRTAEIAARYTQVVLLPSRQLAPALGRRFLNSDHARQILRLTRAFLAEQDLEERCIDLASTEPMSYIKVIFARLGLPESDV